MACKRGLSENARKVLEALAKAPGPVGSKEIAEVSGLETKQVSCQLSALKKKGLVASPARCKYEITDAGKSELS